MADKPNPLPPLTIPLVVDSKKIDSVTLRRLIEEVETEAIERTAPAMYNRIHNRHNRGR